MAVRPLPFSFLRPSQGPRMGGPQCKVLRVGFPGPLLRGHTADQPMLFCDLGWQPSCWGAAVATPRLSTRESPPRASGWDTTGPRAWHRLPAPSYLSNSTLPLLLAWQGLGWRAQGVGRRNRRAGTVVTELVSRGQQRATELPWMSPLPPGALSHLQGTRL